MLYVPYQASMGYQPGKGLGKSGMGIAEPIEESIHKGRRGLGYILEGLEKEEVQWELEEVSIWQWEEICWNEIILDW